MCSIVTPYRSTMEQKIVLSPPKRLLAYGECSCNQNAKISVNEYVHHIFETGCFIADMYKSGQNVISIWTEAKFIVFIKPIRLVYCIPWCKVLVLKGHYVMLSQQALWSIFKEIHQIWHPIDCVEKPNQVSNVLDSADVLRSPPDPASLRLHDSINSERPRPWTKLKGIIFIHTHCCCPICRFCSELLRQNAVFLVLTSYKWIWTTSLPTLKHETRISPTELCHLDIRRSDGRSDQVVKTSSSHYYSQPQIYLCYPPVT